MDKIRDVLEFQRVRESRGLLVEDVAAATEVSKRTIRDLEGGSNRRTQARVQRCLARVLGVKATLLFDRDGRARKAK